ncbi:MAG: hypothetical protein NVSMB17_08100 [Candidatus Dormibacteria bacterium]
MLRVVRGIKRGLTISFLPGLLLGAASLSAPAGRPLAVTAATPSTAFEVPRVADPIHTYGEPDIAVDPTTDKNVAVSGPTGTGTQRSVWQNSVDGGHTFRNVTRCPVPADCAAALSQLPGGPLAAPGGGDTEIAFDRSGKQYFSDLYALLQQHVATRTVNPDGTENVQEGYVSTPQLGSDRQWMAVYDPPPGTPNLSGHTLPKPLVYFVYNNLVGPGPNSGQEWAKTTTGAGVIPPYSHANADCPILLAPTCSPFGGDGYPAIDQATGKVFEAAGCTTVSGCPVDGLYLNIGTPVDDAGNLHFLDFSSLAATDPTKLVKIAATPTGSPDTLFSVLSMDQGRNLHVVWAVSSATPGNRQVFVSAAPPDGPGCTNCWTKWTTPVQVSAAPSLVNVFPWIQAGAAGYSDAVWYGSDKNADPSDKAAKHVWNVFMAQVKFPLDAAGHVTGPAQSSQVKVTPHPMKYDDICLLGSGCVAAVGNRNLADYFEIKMDSTGAPLIVYDDLSNRLCQLCVGGVEGLSHKGAPVVTVARQSSGIGLLGTPVSGTSNAPVAGLSDPAGDALTPLFGNSTNNIPGLDIVRSGLQAAGSTLTVTMDIAGNVKDPSTAATAAGCPSCQLQYVTRWQMGDTLYYAMMENNPITGPQYFAGPTTAIDDCSVSACDPHMLIYPDLTGTAEAGTIDCPTTPGPAAPCKVSIKVNFADIGQPKVGSLLEEVGGYAFVSTVPQSLITQPLERADTAAREIDGVCCYNFQVSAATTAPGTAPAAPPGTAISPPTGPAALPNTAAVSRSLSVLWVAGAGVALLAGGAAAGTRRRRRRR